MDASEQWTNNLTPEEVEAVSWGTSNGSAVMRTHLEGKEHEIWGHDVYSEEHLNKISTALDRAMDKAPRLDEPSETIRNHEHREHPMGN